MKQLKTSILILLIFTLLTGVIYPLAVTGIGRVLFKAKIDGSLIVKDGTLKGSSLIGQKFEKPEFFQGRPSAVNYDAGGSGGSNLGPTNSKQINGIKARADQVRKDFNLSDKKLLPPDFVFTSGSGLDPHISIESAKIQAERIASARKIDKSVLYDIINSNSERQLYFYGNSFVNVLKLNIALIEEGDAK